MSDPLETEAVQYSPVLSLAGSATEEADEGNASRSSESTQSSDAGSHDTD